VLTVYLHNNNNNKMIVKNTKKRDTAKTI